MCNAGVVIIDVVFVLCYGYILSAMWYICVMTFIGMSFLIVSHIVLLVILVYNIQYWVGGCRVFRLLVSLSIRTVVGWFQNGCMRGLACVSLLLRLWCLFR